MDTAQSTHQPLERIPTGALEIRHQNILRQLRALEKYQHADLPKKVREACMEAAKTARTLLQLLESELARRAIAAIFEIAQEVGLQPEEISQSEEKCNKSVPFLKQEGKPNDQA